MAHSWTYDAPSGVYKNHEISDNLRQASIAQAKIVGFTTPEPGYGTKKGEKITIFRDGNMTVPTSAQFDEGDPIPEDTLSVSSTEIQPVQLGRSAPYFDLEQQLGKFDISSRLQMNLMRQMKLVLDAKAATAFKTAKIKAIPTSSVGITWDTDGTASTSATSNVGIEHCGIIRDYLFTTLHCDPYDGGRETYVGLGSTQLMRGLKNDPLFQNIKMYLKEGDFFYLSEVGMIEGIRWVEINNTNALSQNLGTGSVLGEGLVFGDDAVALATVVDPELRAAIPGNFGLHKAIAWYANLEFGEVWPTANDGEAKIIHITSA